MALIEKLTLTDTFRNWRDKINNLIDSTGNIPQLDENGNYVISKDTVHANKFIVDLPMEVVENNTIVGNLTGTATEASKLKTTKTINGVVYDGTNDVVTTVWGKQKKFQITDHTGQHFGEAISIDGSKDGYIIKLPKTIEANIQGSIVNSELLPQEVSINGITFNGANDVINYGDCFTESDEAIKVVTLLNENTKFNLSSGATITVKFINDNTATETLYLNVAGTGDIEIYSNGSPIEPSVILKGSVLTFVYDGEVYNLMSSSGSKVKQTESTDNVNYPLLASPLTDSETSSKIEESLFTRSITINPSTASLFLDGYVMSHSLTNSFVVKNATQSYSDTVSTQQNISLVAYKDKDDNTISKVESFKNTDTSFGTNICAIKNKSNGRSSFCTFTIGFSVDGTAYSSINCPLTVSGNLSATKITTSGALTAGSITTSGALTAGSITTSGTITSSLSTGTWLDGNKGEAIINSTSAGSGYTALFKMNSTNGVFTLSQHKTKISLNYTANTTITEGTNSYTKQAILLDESGNASFPGTLTASAVYNAVWNDYAEFFEKGEETEPGDIIALDETSQVERYVKATEKSKLVVGIHSNTYGHIIGGKDSIEESEKTNIPVGLTGRVYVKFKGKSILGEAVVPSDTPGVGRLYDEFVDSSRKIVGYIVEDKNPLVKEERMVKVLINR